MTSKAGSTKLVVEPSARRNAEPTRRETNVVSANLPARSWMMLDSKEPSFAVVCGPMGPIVMPFENHNTN